MSANPAGGVSAAQKNALPFENVFKQALKEVEETQAVKTQDSYDLAVGDVDDLGQVMINSEKAEIAVQMLVQMRNKILDAYSEIMRMNI
jgi:flagellar hook-basal body complex protein FliE